jgi:PAS domain S-box-containing protein
VRDNGPITTREVLLPNDALLVSQTDTGGRITFANDTFVATSGFTRDELLGSPHSMVRHPHMPAEAFRDLWTTIKSGRPWEGLVKNRAKAGDFYWVRANVTPVVEGGDLKGFISIRTKPERADVAAAEATYAAIREKRARGSEVKGGAIVRTGLHARLQRITSGIGSCMAVNLGIFFVATAASIVAGAFGVGPEIRGSALLVLAIGVAGSAALSMRRMRQSFVRIEDQFGALARGDLRQTIEPVAIYELQAISRLLRSLRAKLAYAEEVRAQTDRDATLKRVAAVQLMASKVEEAANQSAEEVAATMTEMAGNTTDMADAATEVSSRADTAANAASEAMASAQAVAAATEELVASIGEITSRTTHASDITRVAVEETGTAKQTITQLRNEVERIGHIATLIANIAGQTNLLALNATIEAARAGEAGKGFAVVANEVKALAEQTAKATKDISDQISQIQHATTQTVDAVSRIGDKVGEIDEVSIAVSAAMEEQSAATQEISRSVGQAAVAAQSVTEMMARVVDLAAQSNQKAGLLRAEADSLARSVDASRQTVVSAVRASVAEAA